MIHRKYHNCKMLNRNAFLCVECQRQEHFTQSGGLLAFHILCLLYGSFRLLKDSPLSVLRCLTPYIGICHVHHTPKELPFYTYNIQCMHKLVPHAARLRHAFCQRILQQLAEDPVFTLNISAKHKPCFIGAEIANIHIKR
jgi:hypothetical protein